MKLKIVFIIALLFIATYSESKPTISQDSSRIKWRWEGYNMFKFELVSQKTVTHKIEDGWSDVDWGSFYLQFPIIMKKDKPFYFGAGFTYNNYRINYSGVDSLGSIASSGKEFAQSLKLVTGFNYKFSKILHLYWEYNGGVDGWWDELSTKSFNHLLFSYFGVKIRKNIYTRVGVIFSYAFEDFSFYPLLGFSMGVNDHFGFEVLFPSHIMIRGKINDRFELGARAGLPIRDIGMNFGDSDIRISFQQINAGLYFDARLVQQVTARLEGGFSFMRSMSLTHKSGNLFLEAEPGATPYFRFSLRWAV